MNKYFLTPLIKRLASIWVNPKQMNETLEKWKFFFILGFGRSGTAFMAEFLNKATGAHVIHEPVFEDFYAHTRAHFNPKAAESYMQNFRKKEIYLRMRKTPPGVYGEVNGNLRCHTVAIRNAFPEAALIHLVRDGRDVVRSHVSRRTMTIKNPFSMRIHPIPSDLWSSRWGEMDRFAKICWYWQEENKRLRMTVGKLVQFESILSDYDYFYAEILEPCGVQIDKKTWQNSVPTPRNITSHFKMPQWNDWSPAQKKTFIDICGDEMAQCGYPI